MKDKKNKIVFVLGSDILEYTNPITKEESKKASIISQPKNTSDSFLYAYNCMSEFVNKGYDILLFTDSISKEALYSFNPKIFEEVNKDKVTRDIDLMLFDDTIVSESTSAENIKAVIFGLHSIIIDEKGYPLQNPSIFNKITEALDDKALCFDIREERTKSVEELVNEVENFVSKDDDENLDTEETTNENETFSNPLFRQVENLFLLGVPFTYPESNDLEELIIQFKNPYDINKTCILSKGDFDRDMLYAKNIRNNSYLILEHKKDEVDIKNNAIIASLLIEKKSNLIVLDLNIFTPGHKVVESLLKTFDNKTIAIKNVDLFDYLKDIYGFEIDTELNLAIRRLD